MNELLIALQSHLITILGILLGYLGVRLSTFLNEKITKEKQEQIKNIVKGIVAFVEQVAKIDVTLVGEEKFRFAKEKVILLLNEKGLTITETELDMLIESFVLALQYEPKKIDYNQNELLESS